MFTEIDDDVPSPRQDGESNGTNGTKTKVEENGVEDSVNGINNNTQHFPGIFLQDRHGLFLILVIPCKSSLWPSSLFWRGPLK